MHLTIGLLESLPVSDLAPSVNFVRTYQTAHVIMHTHCERLVT